jgi:hypothetical protein
VSSVPALVIQHALRMHLIILSEVACLALTPYPTKGMIFEKENYGT